MARRNIILIVIAAIVAVSIMAAIFFFVLRQPAPEEAPPPVTVGINEPLDVGGVRWQVTEVETPTVPIVVEEEFFFEQRFETEGRFVFVELRVELIGRESSFLSLDKVTLIDSGDRIYHISSVADSAITGTDRDALPIEVHPNIPIQGFVGFEVALDSKDLRLGIERQEEIGFVRLTGFD